MKIAALLLAALSASGCADDGSNELYRIVFDRASCGDEDSVSVLIFSKLATPSLMIDSVNDVRPTGRFDSNDAALVDTLSHEPHWTIDSPSERVDVGPLEFRLYEGGDFGESVWLHTGWHEPLVLGNYDWSYPFWDGVPPIAFGAPSLRPELAESAVTADVTAVDMVGNWNGAGRVYDVVAMALRTDVLASYAACAQPTLAAAIDPGARAWSDIRPEDIARARGVVVVVGRRATLRVQ